MHYDLIIIGGGLVGSSLCAALKDSGLRIALVDARVPSADDPRLFALNHLSCQLLSNLGLWSKLKEQSAAIFEVHVSHQGHFGAVRLKSKEVNLESLGHVIPAHHIESELNAVVANLSNVIIYRPATLQTLKQNHQVEITITTESGLETLSGNFLIGADGTHSTVRALTQINTKDLDYQQSALVTRTTLARDHKNMAFERFTEQGAIAMLPLPNQECATIWSANPEIISSLMHLSDELFLQKLQNEFGYRLGRMQHISKRHVIPLRGISSETMCKGNVFLLGNAAHTLHPIAAQGFNIALFEVAIFAEHLMNKIKRQELLSVDDLKQIDTQISNQITSRLKFSNRLTQLFSNNSILKNGAITLGMLGLDTIAPIKKRFIQELLGINGPVPDLLLSANE